jgi:transmembrane sensor
VTPAIAAEAAVWVARLHGPDRSSRMERECLEWQARSAEHRLAFERCTDTWQEVARLTLGNVYAASSATPAASATSRRTWLMARGRWVAAVALAGMVVGVWLVFQPGRDRNTYGTGVGEQQLVVLDDGTRMSLNTNTRVRVDLDPATRKVSLQSGEALFEVAKDPRRPFVVRVAGSEVVALGTVFSVRLTANGGRGSDALAVTLIEGHVSVSAAASGDADGVAPPKPLLMQPGERVRLTKAAAGPSASSATLQVDRPRIDQALAWKRSEAVFDDTSLADAVAEMNRYSRTPIVLVNAGALANRRISGVYRTGDNAGFARAVAALHGLVVREHQDRLELTPGS